MLAHRVKTRLKRWFRPPVLSVVIPCKDGEPFIETAVRSALNQSLRDLEVIVVDDLSTDNTRAVVEKLKSRDGRIRIITGRGEGPGAARNDGVKQARGRYLTFVDADDKVLPGAYQTMVDTLRQTDSDFVMGGYQRHGRAGSHRPLLVSRVHHTTQLATTIHEFPNVVEEPVLWNKMFLTSFWRTHVAPIPEDVNYEDQEPCLKAALNAHTFDVLSQDVYSWRLAEGRDSRSQSKAELHDLKDRATIIERMSALVDSAPEHVVSHLRRVWLGRDLSMYAPHVFKRDDEYVNTLRELAQRLSKSIDSHDWEQIPFWDRLTSWVLSHGEWADLEEVIVARHNDTSSIPIRIHNNQPRAEPPVLGRIHNLPDYLYKIGAPDLRLRAQLTSTTVKDDRIMLRGYAFVPGLSPHDQPELDATLHTAATNVPLTLQPVSCPEADYRANDPWRSYTSCGFEATIPAAPTPKHIHLSTVLAGHDLETSLAIHSPGQDFDVVVDSIDIHDHILTIQGTKATPRAIEVVLASSQHTAIGGTTTTSTTWEASFDLSSPDWPSGGYFLRWGNKDQTDHPHWCGQGQLDLSIGYYPGPVRRVEPRVGTLGQIGCAIAPPLNEQERTRRDQQLLIEQPQPPICQAVFFESFNGKHGGDSPAAILTDLFDHGVEAPLWWSQIDGTVPTPRGGQALIVGSEPWVQALRSARVIVTNNDLPRWFTKQPGQHIVQTWHGTPIKRLLLDAPKRFVSLPYRRLMAHQVPQWDLLLAQSEQASQDLKSSTGYHGPVRVGEYPRNIRLLGGEERADLIRSQLGLSNDDRIILYAPTWRADLHARGAEGVDTLLDTHTLATDLEATVLVRSHHMNRLITRGAQVLDVTRYPHVEDLFLISDVLVSDYSSLFFDFSLTGRPAVIYAPDLEWYKNVERGFYEPDWPDSAPWPLTQNYGDLVSHLRNILSQPRQPITPPTGVTENLQWIREHITTVLQQD